MIIPTTMILIMFQMFQTQFIPYTGNGPIYVANPGPEDAYVKLWQYTAKDYQGFNETHWIQAGTIKTFESKSPTVVRIDSQGNKVHSWAMLAGAELDAVDPLRQWAFIVNNQTGIAISNPNEFPSTIVATISNNTESTATEVTLDRYGLYVQWLGELLDGLWNLVIDSDRPIVMSVASCGLDGTCIEKNQ
jgi:hypothetical protein